MAIITNIDQTKYYMSHALGTVYCSFKNIMAKNEYILSTKIIITSLKIKSHNA